MEKILEVDKVATQFVQNDQPLTVIHDLSFHINKGEVLGLVGESGSGKSVTSLSILKLFKGTTGSISSGEIKYKGESISTYNEAKMRKLRGKQISMIFQEPMTSLNPVMKIGEQIEEIIRLHMPYGKKQAREHAVSMLKKVGISRAEDVMKEYPHQLSGGMRQRVMISIALACYPELLIADEPTTALDVTIQAQILELMKEIQSDLGMSILLITHDLGVVSEMCDRVIVMYAGRIVEEASVDELFNNPKHPYTQGLIQSIPQIGQRVETLFSIPGNVPQPSDMPQGCKFAPRCNQVMSICSTKEPPLTTQADRRRCSCWLYEEGS
ncbi:ABC transporter ATP-binding protein [Alkalihalobacillus sp. 1P02AB]|uniref:ABC transporter ATP-binding protein n=1 Tax=Alkalihalobacillus sp. 1P02AB TaxID=3132260 RepID=UPI0039A6CEC8